MSKDPAELEKELEKIELQLKDYKRIVKELEAIIDSWYDGIYVTDGLGNTLRVNPSWEKITGLKSTDVIGKNIADLEKRGFFTKSVTRMVLKKKEPVTIKAKMITGKEIFESSCPVFDDDGRISMVVTNVRDLTDLLVLIRELKLSKRATRQYQDKLERLKLQLFDHKDIIAHSKVMKDVLELSMHLSKVDASVLIWGETGVGKEIIAKFIHGGSKRSSEGIFMKINCGAIPDQLLESELFGYEGGAFTGANPKGKPGLLELAEKGTVMLDEIGDLSPKLQMKLLSVIQDREVMRVGGTRLKKINVRFISATNQDLRQMVKNGTFREDLYFRLNVIPLYVPPLRKRREDILYLIYFYLQNFNRKYEKMVCMSRIALDILLNYDWPGNVRELENFIERLVVVNTNGEILPGDLSEGIGCNYSNVPLNPEGPMKKAVRQFQTTLVMSAIEKYGNVKEAAIHLRVNPATIYRVTQIMREQTKKEKAD